MTPETLFDYAAVFAMFSLGLLILAIVGLVIMWAISEALEKP